MVMQSKIVVNNSHLEIFLLYQRTTGQGFQTHKYCVRQCVWCLNCYVEFMYLEKNHLNYHCENTPNQTTSPII